MIWLIRGPTEYFQKNWRMMPHWLRLATIVIVFVGAVSWLSLTFGWVDRELWNFSNNHMKARTFGEAVKEIAIKAPLQEELRYRGPAFLLMIFLVYSAGVWRRLTKRKSVLEYKLFRKISIIDLAIWPVLLFYNYHWAIDHAIPASTFAFGIVIGWLMLRTRSIFSLVYCITLHAGINFVVVSIAKLGLSAVYSG